MLNVQVQKRKRKSEKNNARICNLTKSERSEKLHSSIKRTKVCSYQEKQLVYSEHSNTRGILNFRAKGIKYLGP